MKPFLKWPGGKREQVKLLIERLPSQYNMYIEPFVGAGALFLYLQPEYCIINDLNTQLINCYERIRDSLDEVLDYIDEFNKHNINKNYFLLQRKKYNRKILAGQNDIEHAALTIFLNKTCFNGLFRLNKNGQFNSPWNQSDAKVSLDRNNLKLVSNYLKTIKIYNEDFEKICNLAKENDFVYMDPPYIPQDNSKGIFTSYTRAGFNKNDHERLADIFFRLDKKGVKVMLSNHNTEYINELYKNYNKEIVKANRHINSDGTKRDKVEELLIRNYS